MNRGDRREAIFKDDQDRKLFLQTLGEACEKTGWHLQAWCLMPNHFHLVIETPQANLVAGMKWFLGAYTGRFNRRHKLFGHLFSGHYKALIVDGSGTLPLSRPLFGGQVSATLPEGKETKKTRGIAI
jgi:REP element-mobilizing transposase RayT